MPTYQQQQGSPLNSPLGTIAGLGLIVAFFGPLFAASTTVALAAIAYAGLALALGIIAERSKKLPRLASTLLLVSALVPLAAGWLVFEWHWFAFAIVEWAATGLYVAALIAGLFWALNGFARLFAALLAVAMAAAAYVLPPPQGGEAHHWSVVAEIHDADGDPLYQAAVKCEMIDESAAPPSLAAFLQSGNWLGEGTHYSNYRGRTEPFEFGDDQRLRPVLCAAEKDNQKRGEAGYTGYAPALSGTLVPHQGTNELTLMLRENPHPGSAYLKVRLGAGSIDRYDELVLELWTQQPPTERSYASGAPQPIEAQEWDVGSVLPWSDARSTNLFAVDNQHAGLTLFMHYSVSPRHFFGAAPAAVATLKVDPIAPGGRAIMTLDLPADPR